MYLNILKIIKFQIKNKVKLNNKELSTIAFALYILLPALNKCSICQ